MLCSPFGDFETFDLNDLVDGFDGSISSSNKKVIPFKLKDLRGMIRIVIEDSKTESDLSTYVGGFLNYAVEKYSDELSIFSKQLDSYLVDTNSKGSISIPKEYLRNYIVVKTLEMLGSEHVLGQCDTVTYNGWIRAFNESKISEEVVNFGLREGNSYRAYA